MAVYALASSELLHETLDLSLIREAAGAELPSNGPKTGKAASSRISSPERASIG
jgi:hypothetical protein